MPNKGQMWSKPNALQWDDVIGDLIKGNIWGTERIYGGVASEARAAEVYRCLRTAGRHKNVAAKVYYKQCDAAGKCEHGTDCRYHVHYSIFDLETARQYKTQQSASQQRKR